MFVDYQVENVLSFGKKVSISMMEQRKTTRHDEHVVESAGVRCLRGAVVYGPNASGKSNLIKSIALLKMAIDADDCKVLDGNQFALCKEKNPVMSWRVTFTAANDLFVYSFKTNGVVVVEESLAVFGDVTEQFYSRDVNGVQLGVLLAEDKWFDSKVRKDAFYLRKVVSDGMFERETDSSASRRLAAAIRALTSVEVIRPEYVPRPDRLAQSLRISDFKKFLSRLMRAADIGITDINWRPIPQGSKIVEMAKYFLPPHELEKDGVSFFYTHDSFVASVVTNRKPTFYELQFVHGGVPLRNVRESDGTIRLLHYSIFLYSLRDEKKLWVVDEIDRCLHPFLTRFIVTEAMNHSGAESQLLITTHDVTLMTQEVWRTDEVWFTDKEPNGNTALYSLYQFKPRFDADIEKKYREGLWGAVPILREMR